jgi:molecular chaperone GrpE
MGIIIERILLMISGILAMNLRDAIEQFLHHQISSGKFSEATARNYRHELAKLADFLEATGAPGLNDVRTVTIIRYFAQRGGPVAYSTLSHLVSIFKNFWIFLLERGEVEEDIRPFLKTALSIARPNFDELSLPAKLEHIRALLEKKERFESQFLLKDELEVIKKNLTKMGREQFKSNTLLENQNAAMESAITRLKEELAQKDQQLLSLKQSVREEREEQRIQILQALFPVLDGLEEGLKMPPEITASMNTSPHKWLRRIFGVHRQTETANAAESFMDWLEGVRLIHRRLVNLLEREGIQTIPTLGKPFNPYYHIAVGTEYREDAGENMIIGEQLKGYQIENRPLRLAEVVVSKSTTPSA